MFVSSIISNIPRCQIAVTTDAQDQLGIYKMIQKVGKCGKGITVKYATCVSILVPDRRKDNY